MKEPTLGRYLPIVSRGAAAILYEMGRGKTDSQAWEAFLKREPAGAEAYKEQVFKRAAEILARTNAIMNGPSNVPLGQITKHR